MWRSLQKWRRSCQPSSEETCWKKWHSYRRLPYPPNSYKLQITRISDKSFRKKNQKQGYYPANLKDEITVFSTTVTEKDTVDLYTGLPKIKVKNFDEFYATIYSLIVSFSGRCFPKLSELSSKLVMMGLGEFIINEKKKNQFEGTVFNRNLSNREISGWQYLGGYVIHTLYKRLKNSKKHIQKWWVSTTYDFTFCMQTNKHRNAIKSRISFRSESWRESWILWEKCYKENTSWLYYFWIKKVFIHKSIFQ